MNTAATRAWVRGALRRPGRAVVIVASLAVMTLATVAALVAADSLDTLFVQDALAEWGQVDVEVTSIDSAVLGESTARRIADQAVELTQAWAPRVVLPAVVSAGDRQEPDALILGLGAEEQRFPDLQPLAGRGDVQSLLSLAPDEAIVGRRLAERLGVGVGDALLVLVVVPEVREHVQGSDAPVVKQPFTASMPLTVAGVVADGGVADLHRRPNLLVRREVLQTAARIEGLVTALHLTAGQPGRDGAQEVIRTFEAAMRESGLVAKAVKADALEVAEDEGGQFRSILLTLALLVIGSSVVATGNLLTALGQERAHELAMLRVAGVSDRHAARLVLAEAMTYAPVSVLAGTVAGIPLASLIAGALADRFAQIGVGRGREQVALELTVEPLTVLIGALVVLLAAAWAGRNAGRELAATPLDDMARGVPAAPTLDPAGLRRPVIALASGAALLGMGLTAAVAGDAMRYLGLTLLLAAWWLWRRRDTTALKQPKAVAHPTALKQPKAVAHPDDRRRVDQWAAVAALTWSLGGAAVLADFTQGYETGFGILAVAAVVAIGAGTVLLVHHLRAALGVLWRALPPGRAQVVVSTAARYAAGQTRRSGATMAVLGVVLFMVAALNVLGSATAIDPSRQGGGFDVLASSVAPVDPAALARLEQASSVAATDSAFVPETAYAVEDDEENRYGVRYPVRLMPADDAFVAAQQFGLAESLPEYATAAEALAAVQAGGDKAVIDRYARPDGAKLGDDVVIDLGRGPRRYELIAVLDTFLLGGIVLAPPEVAGLVPTSGPTFVLAAARPPASPADLAAALEAAGRPFGLDARPMAEVAADLVEVNRTFTDVFSLMLVLALVVAMAAEGALVLRAARERRADLALMQALGLRRSSIVTTLVVERLLVAGLGGTAGVVLGLGVLRVLFAAGFSDLAFVVDWPTLGAVVLGVHALLLVVCTVAALPAGRQDPAAALRDLG